MKLILCPVLIAVLSLTSCGDGSGSAGGDSPSASVAKSGLADFVSKLPDLLKRDRLDAIFETSGVEAEFEQTSMRSVNSVSWSWPGDRVRKITVGANSMEVPRPNQVAITNFKVLSDSEHGPKDGKTYVERTYRSISAEEMAATQERMKEQLQKKVEKGEITQEQAQLAGGLGGGIMGKERKVESIEGVGDVARWTESDRSLAVGHGDVFFQLTVDISDDSAINRDKAIALAKEILKDAE